MASKTAERLRKREERRAKAEAGIPDVRQVDASIVYGLAAAIHIRASRRARHGEAAVGKAFYTDWLMRAAMRDLVKKTNRGRPLDRRAYALAIRGRLSMDEDVPASIGAPAKPKPETHRKEFEGALKSLFADIVDS
jgi:hypothetical protein